MGHSLLKSEITPEICKIISREWRKKDLGLFRISKKHLKDLVRIERAIARDVLPKYLVRKRLKGKLGDGIFLHPKAEPILRGDVIAVYAGEISLVPQFGEDDSNYAFDPVEDLFLTKEEQRLYDPKNRYHPRRKYVVKLDAKKRGNFTRFINHSEKPNLVAYLISTKEYPYQVIYFAKKKILPGEQLLVSYEDEEKSYWGTLGIKPFPMTPKTFRLGPDLRLIEQPNRQKVEKK